MAWSVDSMQSAGPVANKTAGTTISPVVNQNNLLALNDYIAIGIVFDNTAAAAPNVTWGGGFAQSGVGGSAIAFGAATIVHSDSPVSGAGAGLRTAMILVRNTGGAGTLTQINTITFSASITAKVVSVLRIRGGAAADFVWNSRGDAVASGASYPTRSVNNPDGSGDYLVLGLSGVESNAAPNITNNGTFISPTNSVTAATSGGSANTNLGMWLGWKTANGSSFSQSPGGAATLDASSLLVVFGNSYVPPPVAPTARTLAVQGVDTGVVNLNWNADTAAFPSPTYTIEKSTDGTNFTVHGTSTNSASYSVMGLTNNVQYWFRIKATNTGGTSGYSNVVTATPIGYTLQNNLDMGTHAAQISVFDTASGQTPFDLYETDTPPVYDSTVSYSAPNSAKVEHIGTNGNSQFGWMFNQGIYELYSRHYMKIGAYPTNPTTIIAVGVGGGGSVGNVELLSTGQLRLKSVNAVTSGLPLPLNAWFRLEVYFDVNFQAMVAQVYADPDAAVGAYTEKIDLLTATGLDLLGDIRYGLTSNAGVATGPFWFDEVIAGNNAAWYGPADVDPPAPPTVNAGQFGMIPIF